MSDAPTVPPHGRPGDAGALPLRGNLDDTLPPEAGARPPTPPTLPAGTRLDRYELRGELGHGAMGVVYRALDTRTGRDVALKVMAPEAGADRESVARFTLEARAAARLAAHPGIAAVHDAGADGHQSWYAMDLVEGRSLDDAIEAHELGPLAVARLLRLAAEAVAHAHRHGVLHRDLKPGNILVRTAALAPGAPPPGPGDVRLTDFGLAALTETPDGARLTLPGTTLGTPAYMAPEQALGRVVDARADVYGLGATLFYACTGRAPVHGASSPEILERVAAGDITDARTLAPDLPGPLVAILRRALASDPRARYPDADALADDLARFGDGRPVRAAAWQARVGAGLRRHRAAVAGLVAVVVAAGVGVAVVRPLRARTSRAASGAARSAQAGDVAERASAAAAAWRGLVGPSLAAVQTLEDAWHGVPVAPAARDAARRQVAAVAAGAGGDAPLATAWVAYAAALGGDDPAAADRLRALAAATDDPYVSVLVARLALATFARTAQLPGYAVGPDAAPAALEMPPERPEAAAARQAAQAALARARASPLWSRLPDAEALQRFATGAAALAGDRCAEAEAALAGLADDPLLGAEATLLRGFALARVNRFVEAAASFEGLLARGWPAARLDAARAWMCAAGTAGADRARPLARALAHLDRRVAEAPEDVAARSTRGIVHWLRADAARVAGTDPSPALAAAIADHDAVLAAAPTQAATHLNRANAWRRLAEHRDAAGGDAADAWSHAIADTEAALAGGLASERLTRSLACNLVGLAKARLQTGADPEPALVRAFAALDACAAAGPPEADLHVERGLAHAWRGEHAWRQGRDPTDAYAAARAEFDAALALAPGDRRARTERGRNANATGNWLMTAGGDAAPWFVRAVADLDVVLAEAPADAECLVCRGGARVNLATLEAAAGRDPAALIAAALRDLTAAVTAPDRDATPWLFQGHAHRVLAGWHASQGEPAGAAYAAAAAGYAAAIARRADLAGHLAPLLDECRAGAR